MAIPRVREVDCSRPRRLPLLDATAPRRSVIDEDVLLLLLLGRRKEPRRHNKVPLEWLYSVAVLFISNLNCVYTYTHMHTRELCFGMCLHGTSILLGTARTDCRAVGSRRDALPILTRCPHLYTQTGG